MDNKFQICPKCNGQGIVSKPPWVSGDVHEWASNSPQFQCNLCNGAMIIPTISEVLKGLTNNLNPSPVGNGD